MIIEPAGGDFSFGAGYYSWELPAGGWEKGEPLQKVAARELAEEFGLQAAYWLELSYLIPSGSLTDERQHLFLAWDPGPAQPTPVRARLKGGACSPAHANEGVR